MDDELNITLNLKQPVEQILLSEIAVRMKMLVELDIEILAALTKRNRKEIGAEYTEKWKKYFEQKIDFITRTQ